MASYKTECWIYNCDGCGKTEIVPPGNSPFPTGWIVDKANLKWYQITKFKDYCDKCKPPANQVRIAHTNKSE